MYDKKILARSDQIVCGALCFLVCKAVSCSLKRTSESNNNLWKEIDLFAFSLMVHNSCRCFQLIMALQSTVSCTSLAVINVFDYEHIIISGLIIIIMTIHIGMAGIRIWQATYCLNLLILTATVISLLPNYPSHLHHVNNQSCDHVLHEGGDQRRHDLSCAIWCK